MNNSKIMEKSFLFGMKNEERRKSLKIAITIYNRLKSFCKLKMNLYCTPLTLLVTKIRKEIINVYESDDNKMINHYIDKKKIILIIKYLKIRTKKIWMKKMIKIFMKKKI